MELRIMHPTMVSSRMVVGNIVSGVFIKLSIKYLRSKLTKKDVNAIIFPVKVI